MELKFETKKTKLGDGAKANHLAYLGDAEIGDKTNVGAGTITCNYDGTNKHKTTIGKESFIGTNSSLVAPVNIGEGAYVGAGSVITKSVKKKSLALTRSIQTEIKNYKISYMTTRTFKSSSSESARFFFFLRKIESLCSLTATYFQISRPAISIRFFSLLVNGFKSRSLELRSAAISSTLTAVWISGVRELRGSRAMVGS